jgi:hypothetical protein
MKTSKFTPSDGNIHTQKLEGHLLSMDLSGAIPKGRRFGNDIVFFFSLQRLNRGLDSLPGSLRKRSLGLIRYPKVLDSEYVALTCLDAITVARVKSSM